MILDDLYQVTHVCFQLNHIPDLNRDVTPYTYWIYPASNLLIPNKFNCTYIKANFCVGG